jgi:hypothetical protein
MNDHVELFSATGYEAFALKKTGEFTNGASTYIELEITVWTKCPNFQHMIMHNEYIYEDFIMQTIEHLFICICEDSVSFLANEQRIDDLDEIGSVIDGPNWASIVFTLRNNITNKTVIITAKKSSEILIIGRSQVFIEISIFSTKFEATHRMVCNLHSYVHALKEVVGILLD